MPCVLDTITRAMLEPNLASLGLFLIRLSSLCRSVHCHIQLRRAWGRLGLRAAPRWRGDRAHMVC